MPEPSHDPAFTRAVIHQGEPTERILLVPGDIDGDGNDEFVIASRNGTPGLWWFKADPLRPQRPWTAHVMDPAPDPMDAGGVLFDLTGNGRLDFIVGGDHTGDLLYWWECPEDPTQPWPRRVICTMAGKKSHDQLVADLDGDGRPELYFWNQRARRLCVVPVPEDPTVSPWSGVRTIAQGMFEEGLVAADVDGDGKDELVAGMSWYKPDGSGGYARHPYAEGYAGTRLGVANFDGDGRLEIALAEGDASIHKSKRGGDLGSLVLCKAGPDPTAMWQARVLRDDLEDPHTVCVADFDGDGRPDLFVGEAGNPNGAHQHTPAQRVFWNRGGELVERVIDRGVPTHEAKPIRVGGRLMLAGKPYRNIDSDVPRESQDDQVHLWIPEG